MTEKNTKGHNLQKDVYDESLLPEIVEFSSCVSSCGKKKVINVPAGFRDLVGESESVNVRLDFPYRKIKKLQNEMQEVKRK